MFDFQKYLFVKHDCSALYTDTIDKIFSDYNVKDIADLDECFITYCRSMNHDDLEKRGLTHFQNHLHELKQETLIRILSGRNVNISIYDALVDYVQNENLLTLLKDRIDNVFTEIINQKDKIVDKLLEKGLTFDERLFFYLDTKSFSKFVNIVDLYGASKDFLDKCMLICPIDNKFIRSYLINKGATDPNY